MFLSVFSADCVKKLQMNKSRRQQEVIQSISPEHVYRLTSSSFICQNQITSELSWLSWLCIAMMVKSPLVTQIVLTYMLYYIYRESRSRTRPPPPYNSLLLSTLLNERLKFTSLYTVVSRAKTWLQKIITSPSTLLEVLTLIISWKTRIHIFLFIPYLPGIT